VAACAASNNLWTTRSEREAVRAEGLDPDDAVVVAALHFVQWELSLQRRAGPS
jgi:hypothetical protein